MRPDDLCASADPRLARYRLVADVLNDMDPGSPLHEAASRYLYRERDQLYRGLTRDPAADVPALVWKLRTLSRIIGGIENKNVDAVVAGVIDDLTRLRAGTLPD